MKWIRELAVLVVLGTPLVSGCLSTMQRQTYLQRNVAPQAAFDLKCPEVQLTVQNLGAPTDGAFYDGNDIFKVPDLAEQVGVEGCGSRARYVYVPQGKWILNAGSDRSSSAPPSK